MAKIIAILLLALILSVSTAHAYEFLVFDTTFKELSPAELKWEISFQILNTFDWISTEKILDSPQGYEANPMWDSHPTHHQLLAYWAFNAVSHYAITRLLSTPKARQIWQIPTAYLSAIVVTHNSILIRKLF